MTNNHIYDLFLEWLALFLEWLHVNLRLFSTLELGNLNTKYLNVSDITIHLDKIIDYYKCVEISTIAYEILKYKKNANPYETYAFLYHNKNLILLYFNYKFDNVKNLVIIKEEYSIGLFATQEQIDVLKSKFITKCLSSNKKN
jgi:hypothetical protein